MCRYIIIKYILYINIYTEIWVIEPFLELLQNSQYTNLWLHISWIMC